MKRALHCLIRFRNGQCGDDADTLDAERLEYVAVDSAGVVRSELRVPLLVQGPTVLAQALMSGASEEVDAVLLELLGVHQNGGKRPTAEVRKVRRIGLADHS